MLSALKVTSKLRPVERLMGSVTCMRPPNILIFASDKEVYLKCRALFESVLEQDCYALYHLDELAFRSSKAWLSNTALLVLACPWTSQNSSLEQCLRLYISNGGQCLSLHPFAPDWLEGTKENGIVKYYSENGVLISPLDKLDSAQALPAVLERYFHIKPIIYSELPSSEAVKQTAGHLIAEHFHQEAFFRNFGQQSADIITLQLTKSFNVTNQQDPLMTIRRSISSRFNNRDYFNMLKTKIIGRTCLYFDIVGSTHSVLEGCDLFPDGFAVIARRQTQGRGRSGNIWMSPEGCAMFSMQIQFPLQSELGRHLSLLQHIAALAIVLGVKNLPYCHDLKLGVKWPNDIYYQDISVGSNVKVGGVLVTTSIMGTRVIATFGCGINLNNQRPTVCLNEIIRQTKDGRPLSLEHFLAVVFNQLEELIDSASSGQLNKVLELYHQHWLHSGTSVTVRTDSEENVSAEVLGVDEFGFLRVQPLKGPSIIVHPDGNSFDMLNGLVTPKLTR